MRWILDCYCPDADCDWGPKPGSDWFLILAPSLRELSRLVVRRGISDYKADSIPPHDVEVMRVRRDASSASPTATFKPHVQSTGFIHRVATSLLVCWAGLSLFGGSSTAVAAADLPQVHDIRVGFGGVFKVGCWSSLSFEIEGASGTTVRPVIIVPDPDGAPVEELWPEVTIPNEGRVRVTGLFRLGRLDASLRIQLEVGGLRGESRVLSTTGSVRDAEGQPIRSVPQHHQIWWIVEEQPAYQLAIENWNAFAPGTLHAIQKPDLNELPAADALEGLNLVVLPAHTTVSGKQSAELALWVQRGGRLVIPIGDGVDALQNSPLKDWLPVMPIQQGGTRELVSLRELVPKSSSLKVTADMPAAVFDGEQGRLLAGRLVLRGAYGWGQVSLLAVRLDQAPLSYWESRHQLAVALAGLTPPWTDVSQSRGNAHASHELNPTGVSDFQTQLVNSLDSFDGVARSSHWVVLAALAALILAIGPLDYLVIQRFLKSPQLTWLTLPVILAGFCWFLWSSALASNGHTLTTRRFEIADMDVINGTLRGRSWLSFYSPKTQRYDLSARIAPAWAAVSPDQGTVSLPPRMGWMERPEASFRGMYHSGSIDLNKPRYQQPAELNSLLGYPVRIWSSGTIDCEWERNELDLRPLFENRLEDQGTGRLRGTFSHQLPVALYDWFLVYRNFAYFPSDFRPLEPGTTFSLEGCRSTLLENAVTGKMDVRSIPDDGYLEPKIPWKVYDPLSQDHDMMARIMSFHDAVGGEAYSKLHHASLGQLDSSHLSQLHRVVLYARLDSALTEFQIDDAKAPESSISTRLRVLLPITRGTRALDAPPSPELLKVP